MLLLIRPYTLSATSSQCIAAAHGSSIPNCKDSAEEDMMCSVILMNMLLVHETHDVGYTVDTRRRSLTAIMISIAMQAVQQVRLHAEELALGEHGGWDELSRLRGVRLTLLEQRAICRGQAGQAASALTVVVST